MLQRLYTNDISRSIALLLFSSISSARSREIIKLIRRALSHETNLQDMTRSIADLFLSITRIIFICNTNMLICHFCKLVGIRYIKAITFEE